MGAWILEQCRKLKMSVNSHSTDRKQIKKWNNEWKNGGYNSAH